MERSNDSDVRRFEESLRMAKEGIKEACEIFEDMKAQFSERGYGERGAQMRGYSRRDDWDGYEERRRYR
jgi:hypothetical protein